MKGEFYPLFLRRLLFFFCPNILKLPGVFYWQKILKFSPGYLTPYFLLDISNAYRRQNDVTHIPILSLYHGNRISHIHIRTNVNTSYIELISDKLQAYASYANLFCGTNITAFTNSVPIKVKMKANNSITGFLAMK